MLFNVWVNYKYAVIGVIIIICMVIFFSVFFGISEKFTGTLSSPMDSLNKSQPKSFSPIDTEISSFPKLEPPVVPEEIGLSQVYPQGQGVSMDKGDSNSFTPDKPGPLLTDYKNPESYGASSLTDPMGVKGAEQGARVIRLKAAGGQMNFKPFDESEQGTYASAYSNEEVQTGASFVNDTKYIDYSDSFNPEDNLSIQTSPGQESTLDNCEITYPGVVKYEKFCITDGDIPYGKEINGKVNPRLVSRWESYTGNYSRKDALDQVDGLLYPSLNNI